MAFHPAWIDYQRRRWTRPNGHLWIRHDAHRFMPPGSPLYAGKDVARYFEPARKSERAPQADERKSEDELAAEIEDILRLKREFDALRAEIKRARLLREK